MNDSFFLQVAKKFFPDVAVGYEDPRVNVHVADGEFRIRLSGVSPFTWRQNRSKPNQSKPGWLRASALNVELL
jgi:hypothetical protein